MNPDKNPDGSCAADGLVGVVWYTRKALGWVASWPIFWLAHWISFPMHWFDWGCLYPTYNRLMIVSSNIQEWGGHYVEPGWGPWEDWETQVDLVERCATCGNEVNCHRQGCPVVYEQP